MAEAEIGLEEEEFSPIDLSLGFGVGAHRIAIDHGRNRPCLKAYFSFFLGLGRQIETLFGANIGKNRLFNSVDLPADTQSCFLTLLLESDQCGCFHVSNLSDCELSFETIEEIPG